MICYITFRSITPAQRAESLLRKIGVECAIQRTPRWMAEQGCGYSLRVRRLDVPAAVALLRENGASYRKVYLKRENGVYEELSI